MKIKKELFAKLSKFLGPITLVITAIVWGFGFVAQKIGSNSVGALTFNAYRFLIAGIMLTIIYVINKKCFHKDDPKSFKYKDKRTKIWICLCCILVGVFMTIGAVLQQTGIGMVKSASIAGFITISYIVMVPIVGLFFKKKVSLKIWLCLIIAMIGFGLIAIKDDFKIEIGDLIILLSALGYTLQIVFIDIVGKHVDVLFLSACEFMIGGILSYIGKIIFEGFDVALLKEALPSILYMAVCSCAIGSTLQIFGQNHTDPTAASLIMSLESVFGLIFSTIFLHDSLTIMEYIGCAVVLIASIITQIDFKNLKHQKQEKIDPGDANA